MHSLRLLSSLIIIVAGAAGVAYAQDQQPPKETLAEAISQLIPQYWSISDIKITASVNVGDAVDPNIKQRFEAIASPDSDLFVEDAESEGAYGPFVPVLPSLGTDAFRTLYGVATATYAAGQWSTTIELENDVSQLGMPVDLFAAPTVVRGSEEEAALRERLRADVAERLRHQLAAEEARVRTEHATAVRALRSQHQKEVEKVETEHATAMTKLKARLVSAQVAIAASLARLKADHAADLKGLKERQKRERAQLLKDQDQNLAKFKLQHEQEMKRLEQQFAQAADKARAEIQARMDLVALEREKQEAQAQLLAAQQETTKRDAQLAEEQRRAEIAAREREIKAAEEQRQHEASLRQAARADHAKRLATLKAALSGEDQQAAVAAFQAAVASGDDALQTAAMRGALSSESTVIKELALRRAFMERDAIDFVYNAAVRDEQFSGSFTIGITGKTEGKSAINFGGEWQGGIFSSVTKELRGTLSGLSLSAGNEECSLSAQLRESGRLEGTMQCDDIKPPTGGCCYQATFGIASELQ